LVILVVPGKEERKMKSLVFWRVVSVVCVLSFVLGVAGCGLQANESTKQEIIATIPELHPVSDFRFVEGAESGFVAFEFTGGNGLVYEGTYDGKFVEARAKK
jgi:hypothetical protein